MLRRLLSLMSGSSLLTEAELADSLEVSLGELEGMLAHLVELGYVEDLAAAMSAASSASPGSGAPASCADAEGARLRGGLSGGSGCRGCPMRCSCRGASARRVYSLTEKGRAAAGL